MDLQCIVGGSIPAESQVSPNNLAAFMHACIAPCRMPPAPLLLSTPSAITQRSGNNPLLEIESTLHQRDT